MINVIEEKFGRLTLAVLLVLTGVIARITVNGLLPHTPDLYLNLNGISQPMFMMDLFFIVAIISIISGLLLGGYYTFIIPISVMAFSDIILGNTFIFLFTWSGFVIIAMIGYFLKKEDVLSFRKTPQILGAGIGAVIVYDLWTNFGCFLGWYPKTLGGLSMCYTVALPFMFWHILSTTAALTLIIIPVIYLNKKGILKTDYTIKPFERKVSLVVPALLIVLSFIALVV